MIDVTVMFAGVAVVEVVTGVVEYWVWWNWLMYSYCIYNGGECGSTKRLWLTEQ